LIDDWDGAGIPRRNRVSVDRREIHSGAFPRSIDFERDIDTATVRAGLVIARAIEWLMLMASSVRAIDVDIERLMLTAGLLSAMAEERARALASGRSARAVLLACACDTGASLEVVEA